MNIDQVAKKFYNGLSFRINTFMPDQFANFRNNDIKGYPYNLKKANELLDKAGYKKKGTYRVQPNGKKLVIHLAVRANSTTATPVWQNYIQQWKKIGLDVEFIGGRPMEFNNWVEAVMNDDPRVDVFEGGWSLSSEPSPADLYNEAAPYNFARFVSKENTDLLNQIDSVKSFNQSYRATAFKKWQKWMFDNAYVIPTMGSYNVTAVNKDITGLNLKPSSNFYFEGGFAK